MGVIRKSLVTVLLAGCILGSAYSVPKVVLATTTGADIGSMVSYSIFEQELNSLSHKKSFNFKNEELLNLLREKFGREVTVGDIQDLKYLTINGPLANQDLSDLKYFTNLRQMTITGMNFDCSDLQYNQNLTHLEASECTMNNTNMLPNTITALRIINSTISDHVLYVPYATESLSTEMTFLNKYVVKNPEKLKNVKVGGYAICDIQDFCECSNIISFSFNGCPNVLNAESLTNFPKLRNVAIDEYATIWLNSQLMELLPISEDSKEYYGKMNAELDSIIVEIISPGMSEEEMLNAIIRYVIDKIDYDQTVAKEEKGHQQLTNNYNSNPMYYALNSKLGICVNYACLFSALANRVGIDNYQPNSLEHTWNMVRLSNQDDYLAYDLGGIDSQPDSAELLKYNDTDSINYYGFDINSINKPEYVTNVSKLDITDINEDKGYLSTNIVHGKALGFLVALLEINAIMIGSRLKREYELNKEFQQMRKTLKYKRVNRY